MVETSPSKGHSLSQLWAYLVQITQASKASHTRTTARIAPLYSTTAESLAAVYF